MPVDRLPPAADDQAWRGLSQSFEALPSVRLGVAQQESLQGVRSAGIDIEFAWMSASFVRWGTASCTCLR
jgi:hypothetical protein